MADLEDTEDYKIFIEKPFYVEPPNLPPTATEDEKRHAWAEWIIANAKARANHKRQWSKSLKPGTLPNFDTAHGMVKIDGRWKQRPSMTGLVGSSDMLTLETVLVEQATQDRHFQARGQRGKRLGNKHRRKRNNFDKKNIKRQAILNKKFGG